VEQAEYRLETIIKKQIC